MMDKTDKRFPDLPWYTKLLTITAAAALTLLALGVLAFLIGIVWRAVVWVWS